MATLTLLRFSPLQTPPKPYLSARSPSVRFPLLPKPTARIRIYNRATVPATDRLISAASYALPFFNALHYGRFLFARFPAAGAAVEPLLPFISLYRSVPFAGFVAFFALYLGVVQNPAFDRYVRFNAMQAVVLDVLLAVPVLLQRMIGVPSKGLGLRVLEFGYNAVFAFAAFCFVYSIVSCVLGKTPHLPIVASAADRQL